MLRGTHPDPPVVCVGGDLLARAQVSAGGFIKLSDGRKRPNCFRITTHDGVEYMFQAMTPRELQSMADEVGIKGYRLVIDTDRHMSLEIRGGG